ncbi:hypothetical protein J2W49_001913 [Hydrogenophaga palleronii]|uniref:Uncharacterized protein n=1 Tax=Hydrogenophaga palleronii TaxID=65655 RepID=A0ABU1WKZ0_9BURK|nr:type III secretion protein HrpB4 [Hydrogenophaga palleronii]MDR7149958.1 hypothetical protein [Hydrogenophaga palleronii]
MSTRAAVVAHPATERPEPWHMAQLALAFERRLQHLPEGADPSWPAWAAVRPTLARLTPGAARRRVMASLFSRHCGPLPDVRALATPAGRLALLDRLSLLSRLCALALLSRPGVMRCCVERRTRQSIEAALGPAMGALRASAHEGSVVPAHVAAWMPIQWACVGYADVCRAGAWPHLGLRRLVRLALPARWPVPLSGRDVPITHVPTHEALRQVHALFDGDDAW